MLTVLIFILVLGFLIFVHELGHFLTAKKAGMKVEEFGFGFPPRLFGFKKNETIYSINAIPFGGFVRILGENDPESKDKRSFSVSPIRWRITVIVAGVAMNLIFAFLLLSLVSFLGVRKGVEDISKVQDASIMIIGVAPNSPAQAGGLQELDEIIGFNENGTIIRIQKTEDFQNYISSHGGSEITVAVKRNDEQIDNKMVPRINPPPGEGALGVSLVQTGTVKYPFPQAVWEGLKETGWTAYFTTIGYAKVIKSLFVTGRPGVEITGPVGMAVYTGKVAKIGFVYLLQFVALISINLAVLNIIPFPALDGGRLFLILLEALRRRPLPKKWEYSINAAGFIALIGLMIYVTTKDIFRFL